MDESAAKLSLSLDSVSKVLAEWTVARHAEVDPTLASRYGAYWRTRWVPDVQTRLGYLAQAVAVRRPRLFAETAKWSRSAFASRRVGPDDLRTSLECLRDELADRLPPPAAQAAIEAVDLAIESLAGPAPPEAGYVGRDKPHGALTLKYTEALLAGRRNDALDLVLEAVEQIRVREIYNHVLHPAQAEIGRMWHLGEISVADEHYATATTELVMSLLRPHFGDPAPNGRRVMVTAIEGDLHALGARMVADFFEMDGWDVIYLGCNTPNRDVVASLADHGPHLLAVSVISFLRLRAVGELVEAVRGGNGSRPIRIIVGGAALNLMPDLSEELGADGWAPSAEAGVAIGNALVGSARG